MTPDRRAADLMAHHWDEAQRHLGRFDELQMAYPDAPLGPVYWVSIRAWADRLNAIVRGEERRKTNAA